MFQRLTACYAHGTGVLAAWLGAVVLLCMRVWVALAFWHAGVVKIEDPVGTRFLFESMYQVPLLPTGAAAVLATWIELVVPWFVGLGLIGRVSALFLFTYNIIAFASYPALWPHGFWHGLLGTAGFADHKTWGLMLLAVVAWGPGRLSVDGALAHIAERWRSARRRAA